MAAGGYSVINAATFLDDLGVRYNDSGNHLYRISGARRRKIPILISPRFRSQEQELIRSILPAVLIRSMVRTRAWSWLFLTPYATADTGVQLSITNQGQGFTPAWKCTFFQQTSPGQAGANTSDQPLALRLNACVSSKLTLPNSAIDAWTIP